LQEIREKYKAFLDLAYTRFKERTLQQQKERETRRQERQAYDSSIEKWQARASELEFDLKRTVDAIEA